MPNQDLKLLKDLFVAYYDARRNKRKNPDVLEFELNFEHNLFVLRDLIRQFQDIRKKEGRKPNEMLIFNILTDAKGKDFLIKYAKELKKSISAKSIIIRSSLEGGYEIKAKELNFKIKL